MALKIRCPHCMRVLVVASEAAGQTKNCPACAEAFTVPLPRAATREPAEPQGSGLPQCPRCHAEVTVAARFCHRCHTDLKTGRRLPLRQRLALVPGWKWGVGAAIVALLLLLAAIGAQIARNRAAAPVAQQEAGPTARVEDLEAAAAALLEARSEAERAAALSQLRGSEVRAAPALARALARSVAGEDPTGARAKDRGEVEQRGQAEQRGQPEHRGQAERNQLAALDVLGRQASEHPEHAAEWLAAVRGLDGSEELRAAVLRTRGLLGDETVLDELAAQWLAELRRLLLLREVVQAGGATPGAPAALEDAAQRVARSAEGLRALARREAPVFQRLASAYWESWAWLGQGRGERFAEEVFALARPALGTLEFKPEDVRGPRDVMRRVAASADPEARAGAGLILQHCGPQYQSVLRQIASGLAELLPTVRGLEQQRLTWALGRLRGRMFGPGQRADPREVGSEEITAALAWARQGSPATAGSTPAPVSGPTAPAGGTPATVGGIPAPDPSHVAPPVLSVRAITERGRLERALLAQMQAGWAPAREAVASWRTAQLGFSPGLRSLLDPGQRSPSPSALAAALVLAAEAGEQGVRREVELWQTAAEQPAWLRALAYTTVGSLDARRGSWESGWPRGLELGDPAELEQDGPGWEPFGAVLRAGGAAMLARWKDVRPAAISREIEAKLLAAARTADQPAARDVQR